MAKADKSSNIYQIYKNNYDTYLHDNITKEYKKCDISNLNNINQGTKRIAESLNITDKIEQIQETQSYLTVKDHKANFPEKPSFRLINPSKTDIGRISKVILDKINTGLRNTFGNNQWRNTAATIDWFKNLINKKDCLFVNFDIESFYPSISKKLFNDALVFAKTYITNISDTDVNIIMQARKTLLFNNGEPWVKKNGDEDFDVPMGSYDGAEVCELVGNLKLHQLSSCSICDKTEIGLYRDDGLGVFRNLSGPQSERKRKEIIKLFKDCGLSITIKCRLETVNFLDVTFDIVNNTYEPYRKPNDTPLFISINSNHPKSIKNTIQKSVETRLSNISCNENVFNKHKGIYEESLKKSGYDACLKYQKTEQKKDRNGKKKRKRKIIWFNPPFSSSVKTKIGKTFLELIDKHFPKTSKLHKIFNRNTVKISYSCTKNMASIISAHNKKILQPKNEEFGCNCRESNECPLDRKCLTPQIVYQADVTNTTNVEKKHYLGISFPPFKVRSRNHTRDFKHKRYMNCTELAKYVWRLKEKDIIPRVNYKQRRKVYGRPKDKFCQLCLTEKLEILNFEDPNNLLNERSEFFKKCRHTNKYLIKNWNRNDTMD